MPAHRFPTPDRIPWLGVSRSGAPVPNSAIPFVTAALVLAVVAPIAVIATLGALIGRVGGECVTDGHHGLTPDRTGKPTT